MILPVCFILFGLVLLISSFFIGRWEGMEAWRLVYQASRSFSLP
ncbi:YesK family protein [Bacillus pumilus]|nr:YesK family protein [Bacillus pumilus]